jgi:hypothetical protein
MGEIGAIMDSPWAIGGGAITIGVLTCWALCRTGPPLSPSNPDDTVSQP